MKKVLYDLAKRVLRKQGYKIALIKVDNGHTQVDGDFEWIKYVDIVGYVSKKDPLKREPWKFPVAAAVETVGPKIPWKLDDSVVEEVMKETEPFKTVGEGMEPIEGGSRIGNIHNYWI